MRTLRAAYVVQEGSDWQGTASSVTELTGRVLLAILFLVSGIEKVGAYEATAAYMSGAGVPGALLPLVIATELLGAVAIMVGWRTRIAAALLAGFSVAAAALFHADGTAAQAVHFLKNASIAGGLLLLAVNGAGALSLDRKRAK